jgi:uridine kinase
MIVNTKPQRMISPKSPLLIGVTGGTASGKTTLCKNLKKHLEALFPTKKIVILSQDSYYITPPVGTDQTKRNWDIPEALEFSLLAQHLAQLKTGEDVEIPDWDFVEHKRKPNGHWLGGADIYLIEGIFVLNDEQIRNQLDLQIFVEVESDTRLARRIQRDITERGRTIQSVLYQYEKFVKAGFDNFTLPSRRFANVIVPYKDPNPVCEAMIIGWIKGLFS